MAEAGVRCRGGSTSTCGRSRVLGFGVCRALVRERKGNGNDLTPMAKSLIILIITLR